MTTDTPAFTSALAAGDTGGTQVEFEIWSDQDDQLVPNSTGTAPLTTGTRTASWSVPVEEPLSDGGQYRARARSNNAPDTGTWSAWTYFTVTSAPTETPGSPSPLSADAVTGTTSTLTRPTFITTLPAGSVAGRVQFEILNDTTGQLLASRYSAFANPEEVIEWQVPARTLANGTQARVRARSFNGLFHSAWGASVAFIVNAPANRTPPVPLIDGAEPNPTSDATSASPPYFFGVTASDPDRDDLTVDLRVTDATTGSLLTTVSSDAKKIELGTPDIAALEIPPGTLLVGEQYSAQARTHDATGASAWTAPMTFRAIAVTEEDDYQYSPEPGVGYIRAPDPGPDCSVVTYMRNNNCYQSRVPHFTVTLKKGWKRQGFGGDACSWGFDYPNGFRFKPACQSHDYGYELGRASIVARSSANKRRIDDEFYNQLKYGTCPGYWYPGRWQCEVFALEYLATARRLGSF